MRKALSHVAFSVESSPTVPLATGEARLIKMAMNPLLLPEHL